MTTTLWSGLTQGGIFVLVALGFVLTLVPSGVINFAQGALTVAGGYLGSAWMHGAGLPESVAVVLNIVVGLMLGAMCEIVCVRPLRALERRSGGARGAHTELVTTVGMATALAGLAGVIWGFDPVVVPFHGPTAAHTVLGARVQLVQVIVVAFAIVAAVVLHLWFRRTRTGQACLAVSEDREAAMLRGVSVNVLSVGAWAVAGALGALAGLAAGPITYAVPDLVNSLALAAFVALALGGETSFLGCLAGGLLLGIVSAAATRYLGAAYANISILCVLLLTLAARPQGIGGSTALRRV